MRKLRPNTRTTFRFIAPDDASIPEEGSDYQSYLETMDESHLHLLAGEQPTYYWLRPMPMDLFRRAQDALAGDDTDDARAERLQSEEMFLVVRDALDRCLVGCDNHPIVTAINPDGSFDSETVRWGVGEKRPVDALEAILDDRGLAMNMFVALLRAANLTETEKKR
ncbi:MAG: hypothetical protein VW239_00750 [Candidatus Nanopelagicales bacterium]